MCTKSKKHFITKATFFPVLITTKPGVRKT